MASAPESHSGGPGRAAMDQWRHAVRPARDSSLVHYNLAVAYLNTWRLEQASHEC